MSLFKRIDSGEKFQKATKSDYRFHLFFFATIPLFMLIGPWFFSLIPQSTQSGFPFWLVITGLMIFYFSLWVAIGKKSFVVYINTSSCNFMVALCVACLEAWLGFSYVKTQQNQNAAPPLERALLTKEAA